MTHKPVRKYAYFGMTKLLRHPGIPRISLFLFAMAALGLISWACSSSPDPVDPSATAEPVPTNTLLPAATSAPSGTPSPNSTPSAVPTNRDWNILGPLDASVTIADFGDFQ